MQELPKKSSLRTPVWYAERMTLFWMRKLSRRNSTGKSLFAFIPPTFAAARITMSGLASAKNLATADSSLRSRCERSRVSRLAKRSALSRRTSALPTIPRWPATKILSDFFTCTVVSSQKLPGRQDAHRVFGLAENSASILNSGMRFLPWFAAIGLTSAGLVQTSPAPKAPVDQLIPWLLDEDQQLR